MFSKSLTSLFLATLALAACSDDSARTIPLEPVPPPPALSAGEWSLSAADGQPLPAMVGHRMVDGVLEQTFVDSARIEILTNGTYAQTLWSRTLRAGQLFSAGGFVDAGEWRVKNGQYEFTSVTRARSFRVKNGTPGELDVIEPVILDRAEGGLVRSAYHPRQRQPDEPAAPLAAQWRGTMVGGIGLPATVYSFPDQPSAPNLTVYKLDSAELELSPNGKYVRRAHFSEWLALDPANHSGFTRLMQYSAYDHGRWTRMGDQVILYSEWIQNQVVYGTISPNGTLRLRHGLTPGDDLLDVAYGPAK